MSDCCCPSPIATKTTFTCPGKGCQGRAVKLITLKSLLKPAALERLEPHDRYRFCDQPACPVVYFSSRGDTFGVPDLKVPIFQKDIRDSVPVCYCFGWTRQRIQESFKASEPIGVIERITAHISAGRCGCEVNNPQGNCCLGNVRRTLKELKSEKR